MKIKNLKQQLSLLDDEMEIFYSEPFIGLLEPFRDYEFITTKIYKLGNRYFSEYEMEELKKSEEKSDKELFINDTLEELNVVLFHNPNFDI